MKRFLKFSRFSVDCRATLAERENLYRHRSLDGSFDLLPHVDPRAFRPVRLAAFHASKSLDAWLTQQTPETRKGVKALFARAANEVFAEYVAPDLTARIGKGGAGRVPVKTIAAGFVHETNSLRYYHLHYHLQVHNAGRSADGRYRAVDNSTLYRKQSLYALAFGAKPLKVGIRVEPIGGSSPSMLSPSGRSSWPSSTGGTG
jgi:hypothetical protein